MSTVFTKIINGELPNYKIYEDDICYCFLDNNPETLGHTLVVPKVEVDKIYDLPDEDYQSLMSVVKKISKHMEKQLGARTIIKVVGTDVPHAHVHLMPLDDTWQYGRTLDLAPEEFEQVRKSLEYSD